MSSVVCVALRGRDGAADIGALLTPALGMPLAPGDSGRSEISTRERAMARKPPQKYNVHRAKDGAQIITGVSLGLARSECARLNAEARVPIGVHLPDHPTPDRPTGMYLGEVTRYEVQTMEGTVIS